MTASSLHEINSYPIPLLQGDQILRDTKPVAIVPETCMCESEAELFKMIAAQHESVAIEPAEADLSVEVGPDGVFIGFFSEGKAALLSLDKLSTSGAVSPESAAALVAWATDRRKQASAVAG